MWVCIYDQTKWTWLIIFNRLGTGRIFILNIHYILSHWLKIRTPRMPVALECLPLEWVVPMLSMQWLGLLGSLKHLLLSVSIVFSPSSSLGLTYGIGVHLTGNLNGWTTPKDLILHLAGKLTVRVSPNLSEIFNSFGWHRLYREELEVYWNISDLELLPSLAQVIITITDLLNVTDTF